MEVEDDIEPKSLSAKELVAFSSNVIKVMEKIK